MPVHTPGAISSGGTDDQGVQTDNVAVQYPNSVDALPNMQYPDMPGGPDANAPRQPWQTAHPASTKAVNDPTFGPYNPNLTPLVGSAMTKVPAMPQYGSTFTSGSSYETNPEE